MSGLSIMEELESMGAFSDDLPSLQSVESSGSPIRKPDKVANVLDNLTERLENIYRLVQELKEEVQDARKLWGTPTEEVTPNVELAGPDDDTDEYEQGEGEEDEV